MFGENWYKVYSELVFELSFRNKSKKLRLTHVKSLESLLIDMLVGIKVVPRLIRPL